MLIYFHEIRTRLIQINVLVVKIWALKLTTQHPFYQHYHFFPGLSEISGSRTVQHCNKCSPMNNIDDAYVHVLTKHSLVHGLHQKYLKCFNIVCLCCTYFSDSKCHHRSQDVLDKVPVLWSGIVGD